eukprot:TRINITY_DN19137_c0_g1_i1.p1 TRINITY_DN19137_c0_g1~~TRINITY_DN19137_c0_g1_i1.p1  ORF type:complete len:224 (+),score=27.21 TRINITY_DN19137_c0_g1_i1:63-674(+)
MLLAMRSHVLLLVSQLLVVQSSTDFFAPVCKSFKFPVICSSESSSTLPVSKACEQNPSSCCAGSTCLPAPLMGCYAKRGASKCVDVDPMSFSMGTCQCESGFCGSDGTCSGSSAAGVGQTATAASASEPVFGRLYEDSEGSRIVEDHSLGFLCYGASIVGLASLTAVVVKRMRTRSSTRGCERVIQRADYCSGGDDDENAQLE